MSDIGHRYHRLKISACILFVLVPLVVVVLSLYGGNRVSCNIVKDDGVRLAIVLNTALLVAVVIQDRARRWWLTCMSFPVVVFVTLFLSLEILPGGRPVPQRARAAVAMEQMRDIGRQLRAGQVPRETIDPWCHPYEIRSSPSGHRVVSYGRDGVREVPGSEPYPVGTSASYDCDIIFSSGTFTRYPEELAPWAAQLALEPGGR
jgi:hypothetical protein